MTLYLVILDRKPTDINISSTKFKSHATTAITIIKATTTTLYVCNNKYTKQKTPENKKTKKK